MNNKAHRRLEYVLAGIVTILLAAISSLFLDPARPAQRFMPSLETLTTLSTIASVVEAYKSETGRIPERDELYETISERVFQANRLAVHNTAAMQERREFLDYWNRPIIYNPYPDGTYRLYSVGENGEDEGEAGDDVRPGKSVDWPSYRARP